MVAIARGAILKLSTTCETSSGEWSYGIYRCQDGTGDTCYVVAWEGGTPAWDGDLLACPVGPESPGDRAGARVFADATDAERYYTSMLDSIHQDHLPD